MTCRDIVFLLCFALLFSRALFADDTNSDSNRITITLLNGEILTNCVVKKVYTDALLVDSSDRFGLIKFSKMTEDLQKKYNYTKKQETPTNTTVKIIHTPEIDKFYPKNLPPELPQKIFYIIQKLTNGVLAVQSIKPKTGSDFIKHRDVIYYINNTPSRLEEKEYAYIIYERGTSVHPNEPFHYSSYCGYTYTNNNNYSVQVEQLECLYVIPITKPDFNFTEGYPSKSDSYKRTSSTYEDYLRRANTTTRLIYH